jgi:putative FmdB family regulatory protein
MPIYAYRCSSCGHQKDVLQKVSDTPLATCPACGAETFAKQLTAAGFQLKGSGWYVTDFRNGGNSKPAGSSGAASPGGDAVAGGSAAAGGGSPAAGGDGAASGSETKSADGATPCGGSCACH